MKVKSDGQTLKIYLPLEKARESKSGKTKVVASTHGVKTTEITYEGRKISVVASAFIYPAKEPRKDGHRG